MNKIIVQIITTFSYLLVRSHQQCSLQDVLTMKIIQKANRAS
uniref:Uncharacterized protein n=1 Tax=Anguilla anguilla TaxID=7936 RepID=A0A0E9T2Y6_ANGAN